MIAAGASGTLKVQNGGAVNSAGSLYVGSGTQGTPTIQRGGAVSGSSDIDIGQSLNAGSVTVDGAGSQLTANSGPLRVGSGGAGTLTVQNGGLASSSGVFIGQHRNGDRDWVRLPVKQLGRASRGCLRVRAL